MGLIHILSKLIGKEDGPSKDDAKKRLKLVLLQDRSLLPPDQFEAMKKEIFQVVSKYIDIDLSALEVNVEKVDQAMALVANIPIKKAKSSNQ
ncbi:MAG: cell division topological specificity factor MinE [Candidatus Sericytochromatia bacterium]